MAKTKEFERSLLALNPICLYVGNPARPGGRDTYVITDKDGEVGSTTLNTYYGPGGYTEMDVSPVIRSILGEKLTRAYNPGTSVPSRNPNALDFEMRSDEYALEGLSVWGQYSRPYKDEDFSFVNGKFLNPAKAFTYYKGLPFSLSILGLKTNDSIELEGVSVRNEEPAHVIEKQVQFGRWVTFFSQNEIPAGKKYRVRMISQEKLISVAMSCATDLRLRLFPSGSEFEFEYDSTAAKSDYVMISLQGSGNQNIRIEFYELAKANVAPSYKNIGSNISTVSSLETSTSTKTISTFTWRKGDEYVLSANITSSDTSASYSDGGVTQISLMVNGASKLDTEIVIDSQPHDVLIFLSKYLASVNDGESVTIGIKKAASSLGSSTLSNVTLYKVDVTQYPLSEVYFGNIFSYVPAGNYLMSKGAIYDTAWIEQKIFGSIPIEIKDAPLDCLRSGSLVYIRFLNRYGGWSYALLKKLENKLSNKSTSVQIPRLSIQPTDGYVAPDRYMVANEVTGTFKAGAGQLTPSEVDTLSDIARSIMVDMWDIDNQCFIPIYPKDATVTDNGRNDQEITFEFEFSKEGW